MATTIGRVGRGSLTLDGIRTWNVSGREVQLEGVLHATFDSIPSQAQMNMVLAERQRLMGYVGNFDEAVVPITWDCDPSINGFYRILSAEVSMTDSSLRNGIFPFTISAEQVKGFAAPQFEVPVVGASLTNSHLVTGEAWFAYPTAVTEQYYRIDCRTRKVRPTETGDLFFTDCFQHYTEILRYYLTPETFYVGAGEIRIGDPRELVVGTQIPYTPTEWEINNGLVKVEAGDITGRFKISHWDGTGWTGGKQWLFGHNSGNDTVYIINNINVLRNSPETVSVRFSCQTEFGIDWGRILVDVTLRRGDRMAHVLLHSDRAGDWSVQIIGSGVEVATSLLGGIRALNNDTDGHRYVLASAGPFTANLGVPMITRSSNAQTFDFGVGLELNGSSATGSDQAQELINQYFSGQTERLLVVSR